MMASDLAEPVPKESSEEALLSPAAGGQFAGAVASSRALAVNVPLLNDVLGVLVFAQTQISRLAHLARLGHSANLTSATKLGLNPGGCGFVLDARLEVEGRCVCAQRRKLAPWSSSSAARLKPAPT